MYTFPSQAHKVFAKMVQLFGLFIFFIVATNMVHAQTTSIPNGPMMIESAAAAKAMANPRPAFMDPMLMMLKNQMEQKASAEAKQGTSSLRQIGPVITNGMLSIETMPNNAANSAQLIKELEAAGAQNIKQYGNVYTVLLPAVNIGNLVKLTAARYVRASKSPIGNSGNVNSQGDAGQRSNAARKKFNVTGKGSNIGILSTSWDLLKGADAGVAAGELPGPANPNGYFTPVKVLKEGTGLNAPDEGRGMAEIIHDVAPDATLTFYGPTNLFEFVDGLRALADAGSNIIVDDLGYGEIEPWFQEGPAETTMRDLTLKKNITFISSAGNQATDSYEATFAPAAPQDIVLNDAVIGQWQLHDFGNGQLTVPISFKNGDRFGIALQWDDRWSSFAPDMVGSATDLDLFLFLEPEGINIVAGDGSTSLNADPFAGTGLNAIRDGTLYMGIGKKADASPPAGKLKAILFGRGVDTDRVNIFNKGTAVAHNGSRWSISSCAVNYPDINGPNGPIPAAFSSVGGVARTRNQFGDLLPRPVVLAKPDFCSPNGANTSFFGSEDSDNDGLPNFFGTSASAPHLAGVAALMQEAAGRNLPAFAVSSIMRFAAKDMDDPLTPQFDFGFDFRTGYGFVEADKAVNIASYFNPRGHHFPGWGHYGKH